MRLTERMQAFALPRLAEFENGYWHREATEAQILMVEENGEFLAFVKRALAIGIAIACGWLEREPHSDGSDYGWLRITEAGRQALAQRDGGER